MTVAMQTKSIGSQNVWQNIIIGMSAIAKIDEMYGIRGHKSITFISAYKSHEMGDFDNIFILCHVLSKRAMHGFMSSHIIIGP